MPETTTKEAFNFLETAEKIRNKRDPKQKQILIASKLTLQKEFLKETKELSEEMDINLRNGNLTGCISTNDRIFRLLSRIAELNQIAYTEMYKLIDKE